MWATPIQMKKHRPGVMVSVLCADTPEDAERFAKRLIQLTGSFGVRRRAWDRLVLDREFVEASTAFGDVTLKVGSLNGEQLVVQPEFASVQRLAEQHGVTTREAMAAAQAAAATWQRDHASGAEV